MTPSGSAGRLVIDAMAPADWPAVRRIHQEGIATGSATLDPEPADWRTWNRARRPDCRLVARQDGEVVGWVALTPASARAVYAGVAWESVYVAESARGAGVGRALLEALIAASEVAGVWTLQAAVLVENEVSLRLHRRVGFREIGIQHRVGRDPSGRWRDVVLLERRSTVVGID